MDTDKPLTYDANHWKNSTWNLVNNGNTVILTLKITDSKKIPTIRDGPLNRDRIYYFVEMHLHWGEEDNNGTEHVHNKDR